jgi:glycosyltransferase involved in cell wall biosynthesis
MGPERLREMGEAAREKVEKEYDWDRVVASIEGLYMELQSQ